MSTKPGWTRVELRALIAEGPSNGYSPKSDHGATGTLTLKLSATTSGRFILNGDTTKRIHETIEPESKFWLRPGDIVIQRANTLEYVGTTALFSGPANTYIYPDLMMRLRAGPAVEPSYLAAFLNAPETRKALRDKATGTAGNMPKVNGDAVRSTLVDLPPLNEQRRIVAKLEALQARSRRAREALDAVPPLLEKLRQSILAAAFRGDLTKDWRAKHKDVEPASELLKRIRAERKKKWEEAELAKMKAKGKTPTDDKWKGRYKEPEPVDTTSLPELPEGWCWASVEELTYESSYGTSAKSSESSEGVPVLGMGNIRDGELSFDRLKTLPSSHDEFPFLLLQSGDLLFNRTNSAELVGKTAVFRGPQPCSFASYLIRLRTALVEPELIAFFINSPFGRTWVASVVSQQVGQANVNGTKLASLAVPVPPPGERVALMERVSVALQQVRVQRQRSADAIATLSTLERAVLAKAFRGELVPQDPNDEPAEAMLARVRGANGAAMSEAKPKRARMVTAQRREMVDD